jgi:TPR repeat protein
LFKFNLPIGAHSAGIPEASFMLGSIYSASEPAHERFKNQEKAFELYSKAASKGTILL